MKSQRRESTSRGINLLELLIVIIIIAILAALVIPTFTKTVETAKDKEAWTNLRLIRTGEKIYRLENTFYYPHAGVSPPESETDISQINTYLKLQLDPEVDWDYSVERRLEISGRETFEAKADRLNPPSGYSGSWKIDKDGVITKEGSRPSSPPNP